MYIADASIDHIMDKFAAYLIFQKVKKIIVPYMTNEVFGISLGTCNYLNIKRDNEKFSYD